MIKYYQATQQPHTFFGSRAPGIVRRGVNYVSAVVKFRTRGGFILNLPLSDSRQKVCQSNQCGLYDARADRCLHRKCGCTVAKKVTWSTEACPQGLWLAVAGPAPPVDSPA